MANFTQRDLLCPRLLFPGSVLTPAAVAVPSPASVWSKGWGSRPLPQTHAALAATPFSSLSPRSRRLRTTSNPRLTQLPVTRSRAVLPALPCIVGSTRALFQSSSQSVCSLPSCVQAARLFAAYTERPVLVYPTTPSFQKLPGQDLHQRTGSRLKCTTG